MIRAWDPANEAAAGTGTDQVIIYWSASRRLITTMQVKKKPQTLAVMATIIKQQQQTQPVHMCVCVHAVYLHLDSCWATSSPALRDSVAIVIVSKWITIATIDDAFDSAVGSCWFFRAGDQTAAEERKEKRKTGERERLRVGGGGGRLKVREELKSWRPDVFLLLFCFQLSLLLCPQIQIHNLPHSRVLLHAWTD